MKWDCILFDLDGTLMDTSRGVMKAIEYTVDRLGLHKIDSEKQRLFIGPPIYESFKEEYGLNDEELDKATQLFRDAYKEKFLLDASPYDGVYELLDDLRTAGYKLAVATNKRHDYTMTLLEYYKFVSRFDFIMGSDHANTLKKHDIIKKCIEELSIEDPNRAVIVGDTIHDYRGAQNVGIQFIGVNYGFGFRKDEDYIELNGAPVFSDIPEMRKYMIERT